jgi:hypothetical protein
MNFQLTGWKAVVFLILAAGLIIGKNVWIRSDTQGAAKAIEPWLKGDYSRYYLDRAKSGGSSMEDAGMKIVEASEKMDIQVTGVAGSSKPVVCVKISVNGEKPPSGKEERCFRMKSSAIMGWIYDRETDKVGYYLAALTLW